MRDRQNHPPKPAGPTVDQQEDSWGSVR